MELMQIPSKYKVKNKDVLGNMQYMAMTIQEAIGGELFRIETKGKNIL